MRVLWAFDIAPFPGAKLPLDPKTYYGEMPGNPGTNLPVTLKVRSEEKKQIIDATYEEECKAHVPLVSLLGAVGFELDQLLTGEQGNLA